MKKVVLYIPIAPYILIDSRHRSFNNFIANALGAIAAYCFFEKKPAIELEFVNDGQLHMF